ncbi:adenylate/guanylate cyclase domain-containing protein [uncultured Roseovarius sp.]|uniref:adenylate/guanylate cyclase domain-containing protein n=1 Tax=uncultured Roseovarius sp. TaxID=293344 RepID=UPI002627F6CA|nr:adenylate/guanylate cyclase domain-containing protein [uncultured Roseovarius sp.]
MKTLERRATTIAAADVVGFSRLVTLDEETVFARLHELRQGIIDPAIAENGGRIVKSMGDGLLVEFPDPAAAIRASLYAQRAIAAHEDAVPEDRRIRLRVGINHGSVLIDGTDVLGDVVNIAARLETLSAPGGICISRTVRDMMANDATMTIIGQGMQYVRNIPAPVEVWQVSTGVEAASRSTVTQSADRPSVIVLPFDNLSPAVEDGFLADGIAEDLINELSRFRSLFVIARGSSFAYKERPQDMRQIAQDMRVRYVVQGAVRRAGSRLRVTAQLIEAETGHQIWSDRYDRDMSDLFALQDDITRCIVTGLTPEIGAHERAMSRAKPTESLSAWEMCQRGLTEIDMRTTGGVRTATALFKAAAEADPSYALPHALLGRVHAVRIYSGRSRNPREDVVAGMYHADRAIELDDRLELGHITLAQLLTLQGRESDARDALARARALNHNDALVYNAQTFINLFQKDPDTYEMEAAGLEAIRLSPQDPMLWSFYWMLAVAIWMRDMHLGENTRQYLESAARHPGAEAFVHSAMAVVSLRAGDTAAARRSLDQALLVRPGFSLEIIKYGFHFPKWPALVAGIKDDLEPLVEMGLPRR